MQLKDVSTEALEKELSERTALIVAPQQLPDVATVYYRSRDRKLHAFKTSSTNPDEAIQEVMKVLHEEKEVYLKPILYVLSGGIKGPGMTTPQEAA